MGRWWYLSKMLNVNTWVAVIALIIAILETTQSSDLIAMYPAATAWIVAAIGILNVVLRMITKQPIRWRK